MSRLTDSKIVLVTRPTRLAELVARFNTIEQARFYVEHLGADFSDYLREDAMYSAALREARTIVEQLALVQTVDRGFLPNFIFGPDDVVVTLGQDGLVANTLKYLDGQPVVGVNPDPERWDGQLLPFLVKDLAAVTPDILRGRRPTKSVTMAKATLNNAQTMYAINDLFIGPRSHVSARYTIEIDGSHESHSSSGVIVSTGLGSTGWFKSLLTGAASVSAISREILDGNGGKGVNAPHHFTPHGFAWDSRYLYFTVREPFPTRNTGTTLVFGKITESKPLILVSQMAENGVIFSDGIEKDFLEFNSGTRAEISLAERSGVLVV